MKNQQTIEAIGIDRQPVNIDRVITHIDPLQSLQIFLAIFTLISAVKRLLKSIEKLLEQKKGDRIDLNLYLQIVGGMLIILKKISEFIDRSSES